MRKQNSQYPAAALSRPRQTPGPGPVRNPEAVIRTAPTSHSHRSAAPPSIPCAPNTPRALESLLLAPAARIRREGAASAASDGAMTTGTTNAMVAGRSADGSASLPTRSRRSRGAQRGGRRSVGGGKPACVAPAAAPDRRASAYADPPPRPALARGCDGRRYNRARRGRGAGAVCAPNCARGAVHLGSRATQRAGSHGSTTHVVPAAAKLPLWLQAGNNGGYSYKHF